MANPSGSGSDSNDLLDVAVIGAGFSGRGDGDLQATWAATGGKIREDIIPRGVSDCGVLRQHYDTDALDASTLLAALFGLKEYSV